jgi:hypothetical protein
LFDARAIDTQWLAAIGLAQAVEQRLQLQIGYLVAQALAQSGAKAVSQVMLLGSVGCQQWWCKQAEEQ